MGAGKTAVGRKLARMLKRDFHDSDVEVEIRTGVDIDFIFEKEGEAGFRRRESAAIDYLTQLQQIVLATGGGAVLDAQNRAWLASRGTVIYLAASIDQQLERTRRSTHRPLLQTDDPRTRMAALADIRNPLYEELADFTIQTDGRRVPSVVNEIHRLLE